MVRCFGPARIRRDERQIDFGLSGRRQFDLGLFGGLLQPLQCELVATQIDALLFLEFVGQIANQTHVEILTAEEGVAVGRLHLEHAVADFEHGNIESAAAKVIDRDRALLRLVEAVGERSGGRLVDDTQNLEARDLAGVLGRLALGVVEISRNGDDRLIDLLAEMGLSRLFHFLQDESGDLGGRITLAVDLDPGVAVRCLRDLVGDKLLVLFHRRVVIAPSDQALDREDGLFRIGDRLTFRRLTDQPFAVVREGHDRGRRAHALRILDDPGGLSFHHGYARICGAEVDTNDLRHVYFLSFRQIGRALSRHPDGQR